MGARGIDCLLDGDGVIRPSVAFGAEIPTHIEDFLGDRHLRLEEGLIGRFHRACARSKRHGISQRLIRRGRQVTRYAACANQTVRGHEMLAGDAQSGGGWVGTGLAKLA